jgi:hypothetical protein
VREARFQQENDELLDQNRNVEDGLHATRQGSDSHILYATEQTMARVETIMGNARVRREAAKLLDLEPRPLMTVHQRNLILGEVDTTDGEGGGGEKNQN